MPTTTPRLGRPAPVLLVLLLAATTLPAEQDTSPPVFGESLDVGVVNVDVVVTDRKGNRVTDLTADDFELFEDGRPVKITNFYSFAGSDQRHGLARSEVSEDVPPSAGMRATPPPGIEAIPEDQRLHLVIYVDNLFLRPFHRNRVLREVRDFLGEALRPGDRAMVVTSERGLHVRQPFTDDTSLLAEALLETEGLSAFGQQAGTERKELFTRLDGTRDRFRAESLVDSHLASLHHDVTVSLSKLKELIETLGGLPGRKALLYVSDGLPVNVGEDLFLLLDQRFGGGVSGQLRAARYSVRRELEQVVAHANGNRVTFYTLDATGLRSHSTLSAEHGATGTSFIEADTVRDANRQESLTTMAHDTGGLAAVGTNNIRGPLAEMVADLSSYYSLGFAPAHFGSGRYYRIEVRTKNRKLRVRHRAGYRDHSPETQVRDTTLAALLHGVSSNPLTVEVQVARGTRRDDGHFLVPVEVHIPLGEITLVPQGDVYRGQVQVAVAVADREGNMSPVQQTPLPIIVPAAEIDTARTKSYVYAVDLLMRPGEQLVAVGVRDDIAGEASFLRTPVRIGT